MKAVILVCMLMCASVADASVLVYSAFLNGPSESPPNGSPGIGFAVVTLDNVLNTMRVQVSFSGLVSPDTASHIHCCTASPGTGTAIVATTTPTFAGFPTGVTSGAYDNTLDMTVAGSYNAAFITAHGGLCYLKFTERFLSADNFSFGILVVSILRPAAHLLCVGKLRSAGNGSRPGAPYFPVGGRGAARARSSPHAPVAHTELMRFLSR